MSTVDTSNLVGIAELADLFQVGRTTISNWYARQMTNGFPDPLKRLQMGPVWDFSDVVEWWKGYKPKRNMIKVGTLPGSESREELAQAGDVELFQDADPPSVRPEDVPQ